MYILGIDIGTSGCKATLVNENGGKITSAYEEYPMEKVGNGKYELNPKTVWEKAAIVIKAVAAGILDKKERLCISVSSCGESFVALDENDDILFNAMLCSDSRGEKELDELCDRFGRKKIIKITGLPPHSMYSLAKLLWLKGNNRELFDKIKTILQFEDFLIFMLTGEKVTDYSLAARTMAFDVKNKRWSLEILQSAGMDPGMFPGSYPSGTAVGEVRRALKKEFSLPEKSVVVLGGHDQSLAALGCGAVTKGIAADGMGSSECISVPMSDYQMDEQMEQNGFNCGIHAFKNSYLSLSFTFSAGTLIRWFCDSFAGGFNNEGKSVYRLMDEMASPKPTGILVLPHFNGSGTPYMDVDAKGMIYGLEIGHTIHDIYRAFLEGISFEMYQNILLMEQAGMKIDTLIATGGGAKSPLWLQLKADMMGRPVHTLKNSEAGTVGAAICAGVGAGIYPDFAGAVSVLVKRDKSFYPNEENHKRYQGIFAEYQRMYPSGKIIRQ